MATKVQQSKTYFPGSMMDLNNGLWDPYHDDRTDKSHCYESFFMRQTMDGYPRFAKEQMRLTILKQESIFRHQLQELHCVYKRQRDLMNELAMKKHYSFSIPTEAPKSSLFLNQIMHNPIPNIRQMDLSFGRVNNGNLSKKRGYNLADLNEPIQPEEPSFAASLITKKSGHSFIEKLQNQDSSADGKFKCYNNGIFPQQLNLLESEPKKSVDHFLFPISDQNKVEPKRKNTIFGVELCERSHTPSYDSSSWDQNTSKLIIESGERNKSNLGTKGKETKLYQMNLDSLQNHSQHFFKKTETTEGAHDPKLQTDNCQVITKILGVPIICDPNGEIKNGKNNCLPDLRHQIDLNLSFEEEETPETIAKMEIDLESPAVLESESEIKLNMSERHSDDISMDAHEDLVKVAAEAIIDISSSKLLSVHKSNNEEEPEPEPFLLQWFAEVVDNVDKYYSHVNNDEESIPEGMDYFEHMTLKLEEIKEESCYQPMILEEEKEEDRKRINRKKKGRQRKDFQRDVLPNIVCLSRRQVSEDLETFEDAFSGIGVSWQSRLSKKKGKNGRGRRQLAAVPSSSSSQTPPLLQEEIVCREVVMEEKGLSGWGKRTRRLPRQRSSCQNGGNHQSFALKC